MDTHIPHPPPNRGHLLETERERLEAVMSFMHVDTSLLRRIVARVEWIERVKDALGITGIVGAGPIVAAAAELMRNSPRRLTCVRCVT